MVLQVVLRKKTTQKKEKENTRGKPKSAANCTKITRAKAINQTHQFKRKQKDEGNSELSKAMLLQGYMDYYIIYLRTLCDYSLIVKGEKNILSTCNAVLRINEEQLSRSACFSTLSDCYKKCQIV